MPARSCRARSSSMLTADISARTFRFELIELPRVCLSSPPYVVPPGEGQTQPW